MDSTSKIKPVVYDYLDVCLFLQDYYAYRKAVKQGFSYESGADELSFNSRSFLRMMILGKKKLTPNVIEALAHSLFPQKEQQDYFYYLVKYSQSKLVKDRHLFGQKMMQILKNHNQPMIIGGETSFTSDPIYARLLSLFSYSDVIKNVSSLSRLLDQSEEVVLSALQALEEWKLIKKDDEEGTWSSTVGIFKVADNKGNKNIHEFHRKSLLEAIQAFEKPVKVRTFKSLLLPMSEDDFNAFNEMLNDFSKEQMARHNPKVYKGKRVYQVNFNIYPVTEELDSHSEKLPTLTTTV